MSPEGVKRYGRRGEDSCSTHYLAPPIRKILDRLQPRRVIDIGAGNGSLSARLIQPGRVLVGVEYDREGYELARARWPGIPFYNFGVQDDPAELLLDQAPFDVVVSTEFVEHLYAPHLLPLYASAVLRDGGYLIVSTPFHGFWKNLALSLADQWDHHHTALWHGGHIKFWSRKTLTELLERHGFTVTDFVGVGRLPGLWKSMILVAQMRSLADGSAGA